MQHNSSVKQESGQGVFLERSIFLIISLENFLSMMFLPTFSINTVSNLDIYMAYCLYIKKQALQSVTAYIIIHIQQVTKTLHTQVTARFIFTNRKAYVR